MTEVKIFKKSEDIDEIITFIDNKFKGGMSPFEFSKFLIQGKYDNILFGKENTITDPNKREFPIFKNPISDIDCAINLYEELNINEEKANDTRLWTYACLKVYREYIFNRTKADVTLSQESFYQNFFFRGASATTNVRNPISKLWWAVHLTIDENLKDKYFYTKILFSGSQVFQDITQRKYIFSNRKITSAFLEFINNNNNKVDFIKPIITIFYNHIKSFNMYTHTKDDIIDLLENIKQDLIIKGILNK